MPRVSTTFFAWIITSGLLTKYFKAGDCETGIISLEGVGWVISITKFTIVPSSGLVIVGSGSAVIVPSSGLVIVGSGSVVIVPSSGLVIVGSGSVVIVPSSGFVIIVPSGLVVVVPSSGLGKTIVSHGCSMVVHSSFVPLDPSGGGKRPACPSGGGKNLLAHHGKKPLAHQVVVKNLSWPSGGGKRPACPSGGGKRPACPSGGGGKPSCPLGGGKKSTWPSGGGEKPPWPSGTKKAGSASAGSVIETLPGLGQG